MIEAVSTGYRVRCPRKFRRETAPEGENYVAIIDRMSAEQLPDEELVARYQSTVEVREREQYIDELFRRNYQRVARWCLRFASNREEAADLAQEIFTKAYQNLSSFQGQSKFSTWLFVIARNHCLNALRANAKQATEIAADEGAEVLLGIPDGTPDAYSTFAREQSANMVRQLLNEALDETEKVIFTLHYGEELTLDAITRLLRLENPSGAKAYIVSAKRKLARVVQQWRARGQCI